jgi:hypothetical protein
MVASLFAASIQEDDGIEASLLQTVAATLAVLESNDKEEKQWGGSRPGKAPNKKRDFERAYKMRLEQYFSGPDSIYDEDDFERRFRMPRAIFNKISDAIFVEVPFTLRKNRAGKAGIHPLVCLVACLRLLAYGTAADIHVFG